MKGLKIWVMSLIEYDEYGTGTVVQSFAKPAKDSALKAKGKSKPKKRNKIVSSGEEELWN